MNDTASGSRQFTMTLTKGRHPLAVFRSESAILKSRQLFEAAKNFAYRRPSDIFPTFSE